MVGRPPKLTSVKKAAGTLRPCREVEQEPDYAAQDSYPAPDHLDGLALETWEKLEPMMRSARVLKESDLVALEQYCQAYSNFCKAQKEVDHFGVLLCDDNGAYKKNPAFTAVTEASRELRGLSAQLGLDPASRTRINVGKPEGEKKKGFGGLQPVSPSR